MTAVDNMRLNINCAVPMEERDLQHAPGHLMPEQHMDIGHHNDDDQHGLLRRNIQQANGEEALPRDIIFDVIVRSNSRRPVRKTARNNNR